MTPHGEGIRFDFPGKPLLVNRLSKNSHWQVTGEIKKYREEGGWVGKASRQKLRGRRYYVYVHHELAKGHADPGAVYWSSKGALDGLVDAGVLVDDNTDYSAGLFFMPPVKTGRDAIVLELVAE